MASPATERRWKGLGAALTVLLLVTMLMGVGPGLRLINPDPALPASRFSVFGLPRVYAWGLLWYALQLLVIFVACFTIWRSDGDDDA